MATIQLMEKYMIDYSKHTTNIIYVFEYGVDPIPLQLPSKPYSTQGLAGSVARG